MSKVFVKEKNVGWIDLLRILAIFAVVYSHTCDSFIAQFQNDISSFHTGVFMECIARPCVVLLAMISGWLLLPIRGEYSLGAYYKKRIGRVIVPLVFWSVALPLAFFLYYGFSGAGSSNPAVDPSSFTWATMIQKIVAFPLNFHYDTIPLWYLYMLIGIYLALPVINSWLASASKKDVQLWLSIWAVTLFVPYIKFFAPMVVDGKAGDLMSLWGECDWNVFNTFYYMSGFMGYMVLAYYLKKYPLNWTWTKTLSVAIPVYLAGYAVTSFGYVLINNQFPGNYKYLEIPWTMCGINVAMQAVGVFLIFMKLKIKSNARLSKLAGMMFGIYLCHFPLVHIAYDWFDLPQLSYITRILCNSVVAFILSLLLVWIFNQTKWSRRLVE